MTTALARYEFDNVFQDKVAALVWRDPAFNQQTEGLVLPDYFESAICGLVVKVASAYYAKYRRCPDRVIVERILEAQIAAKKLREDLREPLKEKLDVLTVTDILDRD